MATRINTGTFTLPAGKYQIVSTDLLQDTEYDSISNEGVEEGGENFVEDSDFPMFFQRNNGTAVVCQTYNKGKYNVMDSMNMPDPVGVLEVPDQHVVILPVDNYMSTGIAVPEESGEYILDITDSILQVGQVFIDMDGRGRLK